MTIQIAREETHCRHYMGYSFQLAARFFYMHHPTDRITHTTAFVTPVVEHWLEREIAEWVHHEGLIRWPMKECSYYGATWEMVGMRNSKRYRERKQAEIETDWFVGGGERKIREGSKRCRYDWEEERAMKGKDVDFKKRNEGKRECEYEYRCNM